MGRNPRRVSGRDALRRRVRSLGMPCRVCGLPIDYSLPPGDPLCYELDEIVPVAKGGSPNDMANAAPAHRCCNAWKSDRMPAEVERIRSEVARLFGRWRSPLEFVERAKAVAKSGRGRRGTPIKRPKRRSGSL